MKVKIETIENEILPEIEVTVQEDIAFVCMGGPCTGKVIVTYTPNEKPLEFMSFREYVKGYDDGILENITHSIWSDLVDALTPRDLEVVCSVDVSLSHGPATCTISRRSRT